MFGLSAKWKLKKFQKKWRINNAHNFTYATSIFPENLVTVGNRSYGDLNIQFWNPDKENLQIGNYVSIAGDVLFILGGNHFVKTFFNYPTIKISENGLGSYSKGVIIVEDDVWIGQGCVILSGIKIGKGAVIAASSVVTKDVPAYSIVGGNPVKLIRYRFSEEIVNKISEIDYNNLNNDLIRENIELFTTELSLQNLMAIKNICTKGDGNS